MVLDCFKSREAACELFCAVGRPNELHKWFGGRPNELHTWFGAVSNLEKLHVNCFCAVGRPNELHKWVWGCFKSRDAACELFCAAGRPNELHKRFGGRPNELYKWFWAVSNLETLPANWFAQLVARMNCISGLVVARMNCISGFGLFQI